MKRKLSEKEIQEIKTRARKVVRVLNQLYPDAEVFLAHSNPWELVAAVALSAQSTDRQVNLVTEKLFKRYKTIKEYAEADRAELEKILFSTGFYRAKARNLQNAAKLVLERFNGKVPQTMEELIQLPGVARKTANIVLQSAFGIVVGIPTDTHVLRFSKRYGFSDETDPKKVEQDLMTFFPKSSWKKLSYQLVSYGREYCPAKKHNHAQCPLIAKGLGEKNQGA